MTEMKVLTARYGLGLKKSCLSFVFQGLRDWPNISFEISKDISLEHFCLVVEPVLCMYNYLAV
jgi:hypothetical protein